VDAYHIKLDREGLVTAVAAQLRKKAGQPQA